MSRDGSGNYNLPSEYPFQPNTVIASGDVNTVLTDIATAITGSLPRDGQAGMTGPFRLADGTASIPAFGFNSEASTGLYRPGSNTLGFAVGAGERMRLLSNGNLIIGSVSDGGQKLQVVGTANISSNTTLGGTLGVFGATTLSSTLSVTGLSSLTTGAQIGQNLTVGSYALRVVNATGARLRVAPTDIGVVFEATDAGETTTARTLSFGASNGTVTLTADGLTVSPSAITLNKPVTATGSLSVASTLSTAGAFVITANSKTSVLANDATGTYLEAQGSIPLRFWTGSNERVRIKSTGEVGIGTTNPTYRFDVQEANSTYQGQFMGTTSTAAGGLRVVNDTGSVGAAALSYGSAYSGGSLLSVGANGTVITSLGGGNFGITTDVGSSAPLLFGTNGTEKMRLSSGGSLGVGISPAYKLDVAGEIRGGNNTQSGALLLQGGGSGATLDIRPNTLSGSNGVVYNTSFVSGGNGPHIFQTGATEQLRVTTSGVSVGSGISTPRGNLDIGTTTTSATTQSIHIGYSPTDFYGYRIINTNTPGSTAAGTFAIQRGTTAAWTNVLESDNNGNVSVAGGLASGSLTTGSTFVGNGSSAGSYVFRAISSTGDRLRIASMASGSGIIIDATDAAESVANRPISFSSGSAISMGSLSTSSVTSSSTVSSGSAFVCTSASRTSVFANDASGTYIEAQGANNLRLWTNGGERVRINSSGNVGIGGSPDSTLHVFGAASSGLRVGYNGTAVNYLDGSTHYIRDTSNNPLLTLNTSTATFTKPVQSSGYFESLSVGRGLVGNYDSSKYRGIYSIGASYMPNDAGTSIAGSYGLVMAYDGIAGARTGLGHQVLLVQAGTVDTSIGYGIWTRGDIYAEGNVTAYSDVRLKDNIEVIPDALAKVESVRGVTYTRKDKDNARHAGVIAQEIEAVLPEVVHTDQDGIKSVAYGNLVGLLIEAVKELSAKVKALEAK